MPRKFGLKRIFIAYLLCCLCHVDEETFFDVWTLSHSAKASVTSPANLPVPRRNAQAQYAPAMSRGCPAGGGRWFQLTCAL